VPRDNLWLIVRTEVVVVVVVVMMMMATKNIFVIICSGSLRF
jgi:hypothetical protein